MSYKIQTRAIVLFPINRVHCASSITTAEDNRIARTTWSVAATTTAGFWFSIRKCPEILVRFPMPLLFCTWWSWLKGRRRRDGGMRESNTTCSVVPSRAALPPLTEVTGQYQYGGHTKPAKHLFRLSFDELEVGQTLITHKRTITEADIVQFRQCWLGSLLRPPTKQPPKVLLWTQEKHGYLSFRRRRSLCWRRQALFCLITDWKNVASPNPSTLAMTIGVRLTVKEKSQDKKDQADIEKASSNFWLMCTMKQGDGSDCYDIDHGTGIVRWMFGDMRMATGDLRLYDRLRATGDLGRLRATILIGANQFVIFNR